jgi:hypothetical protein
LARNPWGKTDFNGEWSDRSKLWTPFYKAQVPEHPWGYNDGLFYISVVDFKAIFSHFTITYYHDNWQKSFYERKNSGETRHKYFFTVTRA